MLKMTIIWTDTHGTNHEHTVKINDDKPCIQIITESEKTLPPVMVTVMPETVSVDVKFSEEGFENVLLSNYDNLIKDEMNERKLDEEET